MRRRALRAMRTAVTWSVIFLMTINMTLACGRCGSGGCGGASGCGPRASLSAWGGNSMCCGSAVSYIAPCAAPMSCDPCCLPTPVACGSAMVSYDNGCADCGYATDCCGNGGVVTGRVDMGYVSEGYVDGGYVESYGAATVVESGCAGCSTDSYISNGGAAEVYEEGMVESEDMDPAGTIIEDDMVSEGSGTAAEMPSELPPVETAPEIPADFGAEAAETTPADPAVDELFGVEPAEPAATESEDMFAPAETEPEAPATETDDMFAPAETESAAPATESIEDLFRAEPTDPAAADAVPAEAAPADAMEDFDSLFEEPAAEEPPAPATEDVPETPEEVPADTPDVDDLFGSLQNRIWADDTGQFSTEGRLVGLEADAIRIFKTNRHHCSVPYSRLSAADFAYVQAIAAELGKPMIQLASAD